MADKLSFTGLSRLNLAKWLAFCYCFFRFTDQLICLFPCGRFHEECLTAPHPHARTAPHPHARGCSLTVLKAKVIFQFTSSNIK